jgi:hypothetical protein
MRADLQIRCDRIQEWMNHVHATGGVERYDDLHIDLIDAKWKPREMWISGAITALKLASSMQVSIKHGFVVALGMSLVAREPHEIPSTPTDLVEQIDWTPPSLYLFRSGREPWHEHCQCTFLETNFGTEEQDIRGVYIEFRRSDELQRSYYLIDAAKLRVQM